MRRATALLAVLLFVVAATAACGTDEPTGGGDDEPTTIDITFADGSVTPNGERIDVGVGQPVDLVVKSDEPGELHIHADPEQSLEYGSGTTTLPITIDTPGRVDVESHDLDVVIVQLEVR